MSLISVEQVGARRVDRLRELDLLRRSRLPSALSASSLRQDQQAVERRAQLVRHVGEELATCTSRSAPAARPSPRAPAWPARSRGSCARPPRSARRAAAAFSSSSSLVCCSSSCCCLSSSSDACSVRACCSSRSLVSVSSSCWRLQLLGERLRLLQQLLGPHVGGDRVEHDADALGQLVEEGQVDVAEAVERGQLDDRLDLALEQHRQDDDVERRGLAEAGADLDVVARHVGEQDALLLERALADQPLAELNRFGRLLALACRRSWRAACSIRLAVLPIR